MYLIMHKYGTYDFFCHSYKADILIYVLSCYPPHPLTQPLHHLLYSSYKPLLFLLWVGVIIAKVADTSMSLKTRGRKWEGKRREERREEKEGRER